jgi:8-oxo-dGTP pyrophosphatase MutT (NUDIX family)
MAEYIKSLRKFVGHAPVLQCGGSVIIFDRDFRILMMRRSDNDCWCFPGGSVELGEDVRETAAREALEETGLSVRNLRLFDVFSGDGLYYCYPNGDEVYNIDIVYYTNEFSGDMVERNEESKGCRFFGIDELPESISPPVVPVVKRLTGKYEDLVDTLRGYALKP